MNTDGLDSLADMIVCAHCTRPLDAPTTLLCAHTVCAHHLLHHNTPQPYPPPCPACPHPHTAPAPGNPLSSGVLYYPPGFTPAAPLRRTAPAAGLHDPKVDLTILKIAAIASQLRHPPLSPSPLHPPRSPALSAHPEHPFNDAPMHPDERSELSAPSHRIGSPHSPAAFLLQQSLLQELTCHICLNLVFRPVTTPCQHTFCAHCLERSLDHSTRCPVCRDALPGFSYLYNHRVNELLLCIILRTFPALYDLRRNMVHSEQYHPVLDTPIFRCQLSFPGLPTILHVFEPRYRLMLRRCLDSPEPRFGMMMHPSSPGERGLGDEYGTMLAIRSVQMLPDGRSMVETIGTYRFRLLQGGVLDGYMVARVERIDDEPPETDDVQEKLIPQETQYALRPALSAPAGVSPTPTTPTPTTQQLVQTCHDFLNQLRSCTAPWVAQKLDNTHGPPPADLGDFTFWMAAVLPVDEQEKAQLLPIRSCRARLLLIVRWIEQLNSGFESGCIVT